MPLRDAKGRYIAGSSGHEGVRGSGSGPKPTCERVLLQRALNEGMSYEETLSIVRALVKNAINGELPSIHELFDRRFGKADQSIDIDVNETGGVSPFLMSLGFASMTDAQLGTLVLDALEPKSLE